jgi:hypothetical protein
MEETNLIVQMPANALEVFKPGALDPILSAIEAEVKRHTPDLSTAKGRKEIASLAAKVAKSKVYLDNLGKDLVSEWKKKSATVDAERKRMRDNLDALKVEARQPLTEWEEAEEKRVAGIRAVIDGFHAQASGVYASADELQEALDGLCHYNPVDDSFAEFQTEAQMALDFAIKTLADRVAQQLQHEADQAELERLRKADEERQNREAEEARQRAESERKSREEQERRDREERIRREAEEKAMRDAEERERRLIAEKEQAERQAKEAAERAEREKREAVERAELQAEEAARRERERIAAEKAKADAEIKRREESTRIRGNVRKKAVAAMVAEGLNQEAAELLFSAIDAGKIPNVTVRY